MPAAASPDHSGAAVQLATGSEVLLRRRQGPQLAPAPLLSSLGPHLGRLLQLLRRRLQGKGGSGGQAKVWCASIQGHSALCSHHKTRKPLPAPPTQGDKPPSTHQAPVGTPTSSRRAQATAYSETTSEPTAPASGAASGAQPCCCCVIDSACM